MKTLFIILKVTTSVTLIAPTTLSVTEHLEKNKHFDGDKPNSLEGIVNTEGSDFMSKNLLDPGTKEDPLNSFKNFQNIASINNVTNDDTDKDKSGTGLPVVRFGGGLFLNDPYYSSAVKNKYKENEFSTSNYVSERYDYEPKTQSKDLPSYYHGNASDNGDFNFSKTQVSNAKNDNIVNGKVVKEEDFNLTPNYLRKDTSFTDITYPPYSNLSNKISQGKKAFTKLFKTELFDWYWTTWGSSYASDPELAASNITLANQQMKNLQDSHLANAPRINLSNSYNELVSKNEERSAYSKEGTDIAGEALGTIFETLAKDIPGIGALASLAFDALFPDKYTKYESEQQLFNYVSYPLDQGFWDAFFNQYLGTPSSSSGLIKEYEDKYQELPTNVSLKNFDIYVPFKGLNMTTKDFDSFFQDPSAESQSKIDLSQLKIQLGADIKLSDNGGPTINELISKLQNDKTIWYITKASLNPKTTSASDPHNAGEIKEQLEAAQYSPITPSLTFTGNIPINGSESQINWTYPGTAGGKINIETL